MTTKELIQQYVTAHADNRWMDASELEALLTEFAEKLKEPASKLTWQDIQRIVQIADNLCNSLDYEQVLRMGEEGYYTEILNRFNNTTN